MPDPPSEEVESTRSIHMAVWQARLLSFLPFVFTLLAAVVLSVLIQFTWLARQQPVLLPTITPIPPTTVVSEPTGTIPSIPSPTPPRPDERIISQEILDLRAELRRVWSAYYLMRAAAQLSDAETVLRVNELDEVERALVTVRVSLDHAYDFSAEQNKGPIGEFRLRVSDMHEDLRVRPEGMDQRLRRLRQAMLSLVEEQG